VGSSARTVTVVGPSALTSSDPTGQNAPCPWWVRYMPSRLGGNSARSSPASTMSGAWLWY
jgi:hypothetical protein